MMGVFVFSEMCLWAFSSSEMCLFDIICYFFQVEEEVQTFTVYIDGLVQDCSSMLAMELLQSCTKPSTLCTRSRILVRLS